MATKRYTEKQAGKMVAAARKFVDGSIAGKKTVTVGKVTHEPRVGGRCAQFIREVVEAGMGWSEGSWSMAGASANVDAANLRAAGYSIGDTSDLQPSDILWRPGGAYGHIAMYMGTDVPGHEGVGIIAENTSSGSRGIPRRPGTKYTRRGPIKEGGFGVWKEVFRLTAVVSE